MATTQGTQIEYLEDRLADLNDQATTAIANWASDEVLESITNDYNEVANALNLLRQER